MAWLGADGGRPEVVVGGGVATGAFDRAAAKSMAPAAATVEKSGSVMDMAACLPNRGFLHLILGGLMSINWIHSRRLWRP